jgi:hypothetical protein
MCRHKHGLITFNALDCPVLELVKCELVLFGLVLRALEVNWTLVAFGGHILMCAVLKLKELHLIVVCVVAESAHIAFCWSVVFLFDLSDKSVALSRDLNIGGLAVFVFRVVLFVHQSTDHVRVLASFGRVSFLRLVLGPRLFLYAVFAFLSKLAFGLLLALLWLLTSCIVLQLLDRLLCSALLVRFLELFLGEGLLLSLVR